MLLLQFAGGSVLAWPDRNRIKLCEDALELTGARALSPVEAGGGKYFAELPALGESALQADCDEPLPLAHLIVLQTGDQADPTMCPATGSAKLPHLVKAMYRIEIPVALGDADRYRSDLLSLGTGLHVWTLTRRRDRGNFAKDLPKIVEQLIRL